MKKKFKIVKRSCSLNRYYRVLIRSSANSLSPEPNGQGSYFTPLINVPYIHIYDKIKVLNQYFIPSLFFKDIKTRHKLRPARRFPAKVGKNE